MDILARIGDKEMLPCICARCRMQTPNSVPNMKPATEILFLALSKEYFFAPKDTATDDPMA